MNSEIYISPEVLMIRTNLENAAAGNDTRITIEEAQAIWIVRSVVMFVLSDDSEEYL